MEFDFLPKLPSSNLDDRSFDDLVQECIMRIPRYCPEWTDHNLSDPGITLIELFAWLTDQMLLRFNQVPRKNYVAFLELLGIRLLPPAPAHTELTFYLSSDLPEAYTISAGVEVATVRTETAEAITFSTDSSLIIAKPSLLHFLTARTTEEIPQLLRERVTSMWNRRSDGYWEGSEQPIFEEEPQPGNCFYLVINSNDPLDGNVLEVTFQGATATPTGINPNQPPRRWEAWDGENWQLVLLQEKDDKTRGFSFYEIAQQSGSLEGTGTRLHLPQNWPVTNFTSYRGRWLRCVLTELDTDQSGYNRPPRINAIGVRSVGGTVRASQSYLIANERLEISDGKPGQTFQLQQPPILERRDNEYIMVIPPGGLPQRWQEVKDFADSTSQDLHYIIDSVTGTVQFGPLIREPNQLKRETKNRTRIQQATEDTVAQISNIETNSQEHQYGAIPPRGAEIRMFVYRTGGGRKGNVQSGVLQFMKSAIPYVDSVINYKAAINGADAESLEQAVIKAPRILRTRDRAVTAEDFEVLAQQAASGAIARVRCLPADSDRQPGTVGLMIVPQTNTDALANGLGLSPEKFDLSPALEDQVLSYLDERRLLGVRIQLQRPEYIGICVQTEIALEPQYDNPFAREEITRDIKISLYKFLNPLIGGTDGKGWAFGRPVYESDIVALLQQAAGVRYLGPVLLFPIRKQGDSWRRQASPERVIDPGIEGLVCSWDDSSLRSSHIVNIINR